MGQGMSLVTCKVSAACRLINYGHEITLSDNGTPRRCAAPNCVPGGSPNLISANTFTPFIRTSGCSSRWTSARTALKITFGNRRMMLFPVLAYPQPGVGEFMSREEEASIASVTADVPPKHEPTSTGVMPYRKEY